MCSGCNLDKPIQNKKYNLCGDCVFAKNHGGKSRGEVYMRSALKPQKNYVLKRSRPNPQTKKEKLVKHELSALKHEIELEAIQSDMYYCWGCGIAQVGLDKSHVLSVGQFKHLELVKENINLFCRGCHLDWESGEIDRMARMHTFEKDLQFIRGNSAEFYSKIIGKMKQYLIYADLEGYTAKKIQNILKINGEKVA